MYSTTLAIKVDDNTLEGDLNLPEKAKGIVLFAHGSGSSRKSLRNRYVAEILNEKSLATLLFDLLTKAEDKIDFYTRGFRFDIPLLSQRMTGAVDWLTNQTKLANLPIGLFGASTGAAAALNVAAVRAEIIKAVVSRGGRPDLAIDSLPDVKAPTLLIVGGMDFDVVSMNHRAKKNMTSICQIKIIQGATHLFEEPGALEKVANLAGDWFIQYLALNKSQSKSVSL